MLALALAADFAAPSSTCCATSSPALACSSAAAPISRDISVTWPMWSRIRARAWTVVWTVVRPSATAWSLCSMRAAISRAASALRSASLRTWSATTAKPLPRVPALAASMAAFRDSRLVWRAISWITFTAWTTRAVLAATASMAAMAARPDWSPSSVAATAWLVWVWLILVWAETCWTDAASSVMAEATRSTAARWSSALWASSWLVLAISRVDAANWPAWAETCPASKRTRLIMPLRRDCMRRIMASRLAWSPGRVAISTRMSPSATCRIRATVCTGSPPTCTRMARISRAVIPAPRTSPTAPPTASSPLPAPAMATAASTSRKQAVISPKPRPRRRPKAMAGKGSQLRGGRAASARDWPAFIRAYSCSASRIWPRLGLLRMDT